MYIWLGSFCGLLPDVGTNEYIIILDGNDMTWYWHHIERHDLLNTLCDVSLLKRSFQMILTFNSFQLRAAGVASCS